MLIGSLLTQAQTATAPAVGDGTAQNPYQIATLENLYWVTQNPAQWVTGKYFIQTANIDAGASTSWFSNGSGGYYGFPAIGGYSQAVGNQSSGSFNGNYDGQGFTISNLYMNRSPHYVALFGYINNATIKNMNLLNPTILVGSTGGSASNGYSGNAIFVASGSGTIDNIHITGGTLTVNSWHGYIGGMLGRVYMVNATNCSVNASISATTTYGGNSGGFIGYSESGTCTFTNCYASGSFNSSNLSNCGGFTGGSYGGNYTYRRCGTSVNVTLSNYAGGFAGLVYDQYATFTDCYATGNVSSNFAGGFFSWSQSTGGSVFQRCYASGTVSGSNSGGFGGTTQSTHSYTACYWNTQTTGKSNGFGNLTNNANVAGKTTAEFQNQSTYSGWDFINESANGTNDYWMTYASVNNGFPFHNTPIKIWTGNVSDSWTAAGNWQYDNLPTSTSIVKINPGTVTLPTFSSNVTLDRFDFNGAAASLILGNIQLTCNQVLGGSANGYVKTNGSGTLQITVPSGQYRLFPVGNGAYNPVGIANRTGAGDNFSVKVRDEVLLGGTTGSQISSPRVNRTWDISKTNANAGSGIDFIFTWNSDEQQGSIATYRLNHHNGSLWEFAAGSSATPTGTTTRIMRHTGYTGTFSPFSVGSNLTTLPVSWLSFTGQKQGDVVLLKWATASEVNTRDFQIEHSTDARSWSAVGTIAAAGNSTSTLQYSYVHQQPVKNNARNYYRIKQRDIDGRETYSSIVTIIYNGSGFDFNVFPNPATDVIKVILSEEKVIRIISPSGATILTSKLAAGQHQLPVANLPRGMYLVQADQEWQRVILR
ncbi:MAG: hypothetical protein RJA57_1919 [Bacteroidota bacterium]